MVKFCNCQSKYQDKVYGKNKRVHNKTLKGWKCTICDREDNNS